MSEPAIIRKSRSNGRLLNKVCDNNAKEEDWNTLDQFEKLVKSEMEYLTAKNHQKLNGPTSSVSTKINQQSILKPEKHVSFEHLIICKESSSI